MCFFKNTLFDPIAGGTLYDPPAFLLELTLPFVVVIRQIEELKDKRRPERPNYLGVEAAQANLATLQMESFRPETK